MTEINHLKSAVTYYQSPLEISPGNTDGKIVSIFLDIYHGKIQLFVKSVKVEILRTALFLLD